MSANRGGESSDEQLLEYIKSRDDLFNVDFLEARSEEQINLMRDSIAVFCLSEVCDDIPMWGYYADSHRGYCIGFHSQKLFEKKCGMLAKVNYEETYPNILPSIDLNSLDDMLIQMVHKSISWNHEQEYRFIKLKYIGKIINYQPEDVAEIILGFCMQLKQREEILAICKKDFPDVPIYEMKLHSKQFKLIKERIID